MADKRQNEREMRILRELEISLCQDRQRAAERDALRAPPDEKINHLGLFYCFGVAAGSVLTVFHAALGGLMFSAVLAAAVMSRVARGRRPGACLRIPHGRFRQGFLSEGDTR
jgi:hypothetical protein